MNQKYRSLGKQQFSRENLFEEPSKPQISIKNSVMKQIEMFGDKKILQSSQSTKNQKIRGFSSFNSEKERGSLPSFNKKDDSSSNNFKWNINQLWENDSQKENKPLNSKENFFDINTQRSRNQQFDSTSSIYCDTKPPKSLRSQPFSPTGIFDQLSQKIEQQLFQKKLFPRENNSFLQLNKNNKVEEKSMEDEPERDKDYFESLVFREVPVNKQENISTLQQVTNNSFQKYEKFESITGTQCQLNEKLIQTGKFGTNDSIQSSKDRKSNQFICKLSEVQKFLSEDNLPTQNEVRRITEMMMDYPDFDSLSTQYIEELQKLTAVIQFRIRNRNCQTIESKKLSF